MSANETWSGHLSDMTNEFISEKVTTTVFNWRSEFKRIAKVLFCNADQKKVTDNARGSILESFWGIRDKASWKFDI